MSAQRSEQSSPYSESARPASTDQVFDRRRMRWTTRARPAVSTLAEELGAIVTELSHDSLETLLVVARRLARIEEKGSPCL